MLAAAGPEARSRSRCDSFSTLSRAICCHMLSVLLFRLSPLADLRVLHIGSQLALESRSCIGVDAANPMQCVIHLFKHLILKYLAPRIFLYKYIIFSQLRIWLPGSAAGRLCEYRLIEPACSCSESVLIEPVAHFHFCSSKLGFTRGIDGLVAPSLAACDSLFEPPAAPAY